MRRPGHSVFDACSDAYSGARLGLAILAACLAAACHAPSIQSTEAPAKRAERRDDPTANDGTQAVKPRPPGTDPPLDASQGGEALVELTPKSSFKAGDKKVVFYGNPAKAAYRFAVVADGYTEGEYSQYLHDVSLMLSKLFSHAVFRKNQDLFAFTALFSPSEQSAKAQGRKDSSTGDGIKGARFNTRFWTEWIDSDFDRVGEFIKQMDPEATTAWLLFNTAEGGGVAGRGGDLDIALFTSSPSSAVDHETAHTIGKLGDEYDRDWKLYETPNTTQSREAPPWKALLGKDGVSVMPIGKSNGWYRPTDACVMNVGAAKFCPVCDAALDKVMEDKRRASAGGG